MPLSEDEQRILQDIERSFYENDPAFARSVGAAALYRHASRNCKLAVVGILLSLGILLATFTQLPVVAFLGFLGMLGCTAFLVQNARRLAKVGWRDVAESEKAKQVGSSINGAPGRLRSRFRRK